MPALPADEEWLRRPLAVIRTSDREVIAALQHTQQDLARQIAELERRFSGKVGEAVRRQQLYMVRRNILMEQGRLWRRLGDITQARRLEAVARVIDLNKLVDKHFLVDVAKMGGLGNQIANAIALATQDAAERSIDRMITRLNGDSYVPLSQRVYNSSVNIDGQVNRLVNSALARGLSAREFVMEARQFINPNTPGGLRYASMRLARTEINNAAHAVAINAVQDKPWIESMKWNLSGSHPKPDVCNELARGGKKNDGVYAKDEVPAKPHPQCFCFVTPETPDDDEFLDNLLGGKYNDYLNKYNQERGRGAFDTSILTPKRPTPVKPSLVHTPPPKPFKLPPVPKPVTPASKLRTPKLDKTKKIVRRPGDTRLPQIRDDAFAVNPNYRPGTQYSVNCSHCTNAFELRARGYDVEASPLPTTFGQNGRNANDIMREYVRPDGTPHNRSLGFLYDFNSVENIVNTWPDGARGFVVVSWRSGGGHIFNVERINGEIRWIETQTSKSTLKAYADITRYKRQARDFNAWGVVRVDDLVPTDGVLKFTA